MTKIPGFSDAEVRVCIPHRSIGKFYCTDKKLTAKDYSVFARKVEQINTTIIRLEHIRSLLEKIMLRHWPDDNHP